jgi:hypothetical protein
MHEPERDGQIAVAIGRDKRHEMLVPADLDWCRERQTRARQRGEALCDRLPSGSMAQPRPGQTERDARNADGRC